MKNADVIIVGGGPAGLSAALVLGRCGRVVLLFDTGEPRNKKSQGVHNYITRDGILPSDFVDIARSEIKKYGVNFFSTQIVSATKNKNGFTVKDKKGNSYSARKLLLATGVKDKLPVIPGFEECLGKSVFHCPYCDAWEVRNKPLGVYAKNRNGFPLAISLLNWSSNVTLYTDGRNYLRQVETDILKRKKIAIVSEKINALENKNGRIKFIVFRSGRKIPCEGLFFVNGYVQGSDLAAQLGCPSNKKSVIETNRLEQTNIYGLYVAGDSSRDMHFVVVAAAEGAKAAVNINKELQREELLRRK